MSEPLSEALPPPAPPVYRGAGKTVAAVVAAYILFSLLLPLPSFDFETMGRGLQLFLIFAPTVVFMLLQIGLALALVRVRLSQTRSWVGACAALALWGIVLQFVHPVDGASHAVNLLLFLLQKTLLGLLMTVGLTFLGTLLALIIRDPNLLLPVALVAMPVDFVGAMTSQGFTHTIMEHAPKFVNSVSVAVPAITSHTRHGVSLGPIAWIGPGDVLFMALYFTVVQRFQLNQRGTFWWIFGLLSLSMLLVIGMSDFPVGALVPMGLAVIAANFRCFRLKRDEMFAILYAGILVAVLVGFFFWASHKYMFHGK